MRGLLLVPFFSLGCGAGAPAVEKTPIPDPVTTAALAGHRCTGSGHCACRPAGGETDQKESAPPAPGTRRFELRVASSDGTAWVTLDGKGTLYKDRERHEDCYYVDLAPGDHTVALLAKASNEQGGGIGVGLRVYEHEPVAGRWYESFLFGCGAPGACAKDQLEDWKLAVEQDRTLMWDPCGSSRIRALRWESGRMPDALHPEEVMVAFTLKVGTHTPSKAPRDPSCPVN